MPDPFDVLESAVIKRIYTYLDLRTRIRIERVSQGWKRASEDSYLRLKGDVWFYLIFRKASTHVHTQRTVKISYDGPIFWSRQVFYMYMCICHLERHEICFKALGRKIGSRIDRICIVDTPVNYPFLTDDFYSFILRTLSNIKWIYIREIDLEPVSGTTVQALSRHPTLKKIILHYCRNTDVFVNFKSLRQLLVVNKQIEVGEHEAKGLKYLEAFDEQIKKMNMQNDLERLQFEERTKTGDITRELVRGQSTSSDASTEK